jgi:hypothetical protein
MGFNLNRLKKQYGVGSAAKLGYAGARNPGTFNYDAAKVDADKAVIAEDVQQANYDAQLANYDADKAAYDTYAAQYDQRLQNTPMYAQQQFSQSKRPASETPDTVNQMYQKYLGRENENNPARSPGSNLPDWVDAPEPGSINMQVMGMLKNPLTGEIYDTSSSGYSLNKNATQQVSDAERNAFLRNAETEFAQRGINNTGNQNVMNQSGNYYGNVLGAPTTIGNYSGYSNPGAGGVVPPGAGGVVPPGGGVPPGTGPGGGGGTEGDFEFNPDDISLSPNGQVALPKTGFLGPVQFPGTSTPVSGNTVNSDGTIVDANGVPIDYDYSGATYTGGFTDPIQAIDNFDIDFDLDDFELENFDLFGPQPMARGGAIKGYAAGDLASNPGHRFVQNPVDFVEEEELDVTLTGDPLDMDVMIQEQQAAAAPSRSESMQEMLTMLKNNQGTSYDAGIASSQDSYNQSASDFQSLIEDMATNQSKGPSESEKWFRIAAALGKPTETGNFFEGLGNVNTVLADVASERREAGTQGDALRLQSAQFGMGLLQEQLESDKTLAAGERRRNERLQEMFLDWERESQTLTDQRAYDLLSLQEQRKYDADLKTKTPQSEAGLIALEMGFEVGTDEYTKQITDWYDREEERKDLEIKTLTMQANQLTNKEIDLKAETDADILSQGAAINLLEEALTLNENSYTNSIADTLAKGVASITDPDSEKYMNTEKLMNVLSKGALMTLKATFGGNISDGERAANLDLQGTSSKSLEARRDIIQQALDTMRQLQDETEIKLQTISSGSYSRRSAAK